MKKIFILFCLINFSIFSNYNEKILNKETVAGIKYAVDYEVPINKGKFPNEEMLNKIAYNEKLKNPGYENYFIHFFLPGMELGEGAFAVSNNTNNSNPDMSVKILYFMLVNNPEYSERLKLNSEGKYYLENYTSSKEEKTSNKNTIDYLENIGAKIETEYITTNGKLEIYGVSNLPDGMSLTVTLENKEIKYIAQDVITVSENGSFIVGPFSNSNYRLKNGNYKISITSPYPHLQTEDVQNIIGRKGEKLKSNITIEEEGYHFIEYKGKYKI